MYAAKAIYAATSPKWGVLAKLEPKLPPYRHCPTVLMQGYQGYFTSTVQVLHAFHTNSVGDGQIPVLKRAGQLHCRHWRCRGRALEQGSGATWAVMKSYIKEMEKKS